MEIKVYINRSEKKAAPCLWENGGSYGPAGNALIVCDSEGNPKMPLFVKKTGMFEECGNHALIAIDRDDYIVQCAYSKEVNSATMNILKIKRIAEELAICELEHSLSCYEKRWTEQLSDNKLLDAIKACWHKANDYHCARTYFVKNNF